MAMALDGAAKPRYFLQLMEERRPSSPIWAFAMANSYLSLCLAENRDFPRPEWWTHQRLLTLSAEALVAAPELDAVHVMRAGALTGGTAMQSLGYDVQVLSLT
jgi:hypothetical protein